MAFTCFTDEVPTCQACDGPVGYLGTLGNLDHWQCRNCGLPTHTPALDSDDDAGDDDAE